jgi:hypothetical protein
MPDSMRLGASGYRNANRFDGIGAVLRGFSKALDLRSAVQL